MNMGFGKFLLGGACAVGAIIAAPVVLPAAGMAIAGSSLTGAAGLTAGMAIAGASSTTAAVVAGAAGVAAGAAHEKKIENAYDKGCKEGYMAASKEYEKKLRDQEAKFNQKITELKSAAERRDAAIIELKNVIEDMTKYIEEQEREIERLKCSGENVEELEKYIDRLKSRCEQENRELLAS